MIIRKETPADIEAISEVTIAAFNTLPISQHTEQFIIKALRKASVLTISLVAEIDGAIVGHIAFSPITISDGTAGWFGLGPISVLPKYHRQGIGTALMNAGLAELKKIDAKGCALVGHPDFYKRFGFRNIPQLIHEDIPQEFFLILPLANDIPRGVVTFHESFMARS